jgi:hypothetical protein
MFHARIANFFPQNGTNRHKPAQKGTNRHKVGQKGTKKTKPAQKKPLWPNLAQNVILFLTSKLKLTDSFLKKVSY